MFPGCRSTVRVLPGPIYEVNPQFCGLGLHFGFCAPDHHFGLCGPEQLGGSALCGLGRHVRVCGLFGRISRLRRLDRHLGLCSSERRGGSAVSGFGPH